MDTSEVRGERVMVEADPFAGRWDTWGGCVWPAKWLALPEGAGGDGGEAGEGAKVVAYRLRVRVEGTARVRVHVSGDERYELYLDGELVGRGPTRCDGEHWAFESYDLRLGEGERVLAARVWWLGGERGLAPAAQMRVRAGFVLAAEGGEGEGGEGWSTGVGAWEVKVLSGYEFVSPPSHSAGGYAGGFERIDGDQYSWGGERGEGSAGGEARGDQTLRRPPSRLLSVGVEEGGEGWEVAEVVEEARGVGGRAWGESGASRSPHVLVPTTLPAQRESVRGAGVVRHAEHLAADEGPVVEAERGQGAIYAAVDESRHDVTLAEAMAGVRGVTGEGTKLDHAESATITAGSRVRVIFDLEDYVCGRPEVTVSGGAGSAMRLHWAEALYMEADPKASKGDRDEVAGKFFIGKGDEFLPGGSGGEGEGGGDAKRMFTTLWWRAGRYVELLIEVGDEPLTLHALAVRETRYPLDFEDRFESEAAWQGEVRPMLRRGLQMCCHETFMDCPYYEQLQYVGDTRLQALVVLATTRDDRPVRRAIELWDGSRGPVSGGLVQSRYPSSSPQVIPPFALWWVAMVYDLALWRGGQRTRTFVRARMPGVRAVMEAYRAEVDDAGLLHPMDGWQFMDWAPQWDRGIPPTATAQPTAPAQFQLALVLRYKAELEAWLGEAELATRDRATAERVLAAGLSAFWDDAAGCLADDLNHEHHSEHAQCLAVLGGGLRGGLGGGLAGDLPEGMAERLGEALERSGELGLTRCTIYFSHYLFEACRVLRRPGPMWSRWEELWRPLPGLGFRTPPERPEPSRSDCHAWSSHPLYHEAATVLGVRPSEFGFERVRVEPMLGPLGWARGAVPHPLGGEVRVSVRAEGGRVTGDVALPAGVTGELVVGGEVREILSGVTGY